MLGRTTPLGDPAQDRPGVQDLAFGKQQPPRASRTWMRERSSGRYRHTPHPCPQPSLHPYGGILDDDTPISFHPQQTAGLQEDERLRFAKLYFFGRHPDGKEIIQSRTGQDDFNDLLRRP